MLGLGHYESGDEEDDRSSEVDEPTEPSKSDQKAQQVQQVQQAGPERVLGDSSGFSTTPPSRRDQEHPISAEAQDEPVMGPMVGPSIPQAYPSPANGESSRTQSPYSTTRSLMRDITLPPVPNLDIPPSPPGSPPASTSAKFAHFRELKKQGVHFNERLAKSSALKNPSLLQKLTSFAGIDEKDQYASSLPKEIWDPDAFPDWAYKEGLAKSQQEVLKQKEEQRAKAQREALDFVPATASNDSSRGGTPGVTGGGKGIGKSAAERIMAGLDREKAKSPMANDGQRRSQMERRGGRYG
ncbi:MAG: hypothetical protein M1837_000959 [Sclerophora amabilis]|nr:MAG: hypothetical protein M1837_000959 [Sclerophora amabilis]